MRAPGEVGPGSLLGLAALESGWGKSAPAVHDNNPLNLEPGPNFPGATSTWTSRGSVTYGYYPNLAADYMSFAGGYFGRREFGLSAPASFAAELDPAGQLHYSNDGEVAPSDYIRSVAVTINSVLAVPPCIF